MYARSHVPAAVDAAPVAAHASSTDLAPWGNAAAQEGLGPVAGGSLSTLDAAFARYDAAGAGTSKEHDAFQAEYAQAQVYLQHLTLHRLNALDGLLAAARADAQEKQQPGFAESLLVDGVTAVVGLVAGKLGAAVTGKVAALVGEYVLDAAWARSCM